MMDIVTIAVFLALVVVFVIQSWKARGKLSARDRWALITSFVAAVTGFAIASLLINWVVVPPAIWLVAVGLLAGGVIGAVLRWPGLTWFAGTRPIGRTIAVSTSLFICALIIGMAVI
jgi:hypothetical protein